MWSEGTFLKLAAPSLITLPKQSSELPVGLRLDENTHVPLLFSSANKSDLILGKTKRTLQCSEADLLLDAGIVTMW